MGFFKSTKGSIISEYFCIDHNLGPFPKGDMVNVALYEDHLTLSNLRTKTPITLEYSQIFDVYYGAHRPLGAHYETKLAPYFVGEMLFGDIGGAIGAASELRKKTKVEKKKVFYFLIGYTSAEGETSVLAFQDTRMFKGHKLFKKLVELSGVTPQAEEQITHL